jgi:DNA-binding beta-propeller fold protein YncE
MAVSAGTRPEQIVPVAKSVLAAAEPQPNGTMWALAGSTVRRQLIEFELPGGQAVGRIPVSNAAQAVAQSLTGTIGLALAARNTGALELLDGATGKITRIVRLTAPARAVAIGSDGTTFYVLTAAAAHSRVAIVDSRDGRVRGTIPLPTGAISLVPDVQQTTLYVLQRSGRVSEISIAGGKVMASFVVGDSGQSLAISPDGSTLYALKGTAATANVAVVDVATESVRRALPAPSHCLEVLTSASGSQLYEVVGTAGYGNIQIFAA